MDLIYMNTDRVEIGILQHFTLDLDVAKDKDFEIKVLEDNAILDAGWWWYIAGTEYGGRIDKVSHNTNEKTVTYYGRNWRGLLNSKIIEPSDGTSYVYADGIVADTLQGLIEKLEFDGLFVVDGEPEEGTEAITTPLYQYPRFCTLYDGMMGLLQSLNAKIRIEYDPSISKVVLKPVNIADHSDYLTYISDNSLNFVVTQRKGGINHLVCLGQGEEENRAVIHLFLDEDNAVQRYTLADSPIRNTDYILDKRNQVIDGLDERTQVYDYPNAPITYNYVLLSAIPRDWKDRYMDYYTLDPRQEDEDLSSARYKNVESVEEDRYTLTTSKPSDWNNNYSSYFYFDFLSGEYKAAGEYEGEAEWTVWKNPPSDWETNFGSYYLRNWNGVEYVYTPIGSGTNVRHEPQTKRPDDWSTNYKNYYVLEQINKIEPKYTYTKLDTKTAPTWKKNTFYKKSGSSYSLTTTEPPKWKTNWKDYYTRMAESIMIANYKPVYDYRSVQPTSSGKAPTWQANKYYTKYSDSVPPSWAEVTIGSQKVVSKRVPMVAPEWEEDTYYSYMKMQVAPPFTQGIYYIRYEDWYKELAAGGIEKFKDINKSESQTVTLADIEAEIGDVVSGYDTITQIEVYETVTNMIVKIKGGVLSVDYEIGGKI